LWSAAWSRADRPHGRDGEHRQVAGEEDRCSKPESAAGSERDCGRAGDGGAERAEDEGAERGSENDAVYDDAGAPK
jgi:hypothetical protein